jgi:hypothetical protein
MYRKVTISMDPKIYEGLIRVIGAGRISAFLNELAKPYVDNDALEAAYTEMARDPGREYQATEWVENLTPGVADDER